MTFDVWQIAVLTFVWAFALRWMYQSGFSQGEDKGMGDGIHIVVQLLSRNKGLMVTHEGDNIVISKLTDDWEDIVVEQLKVNKEMFPGDK